MFIYYIGTALQDKFSIECSNWIDEGVYMDRNLTRDKQNGEPLTYLYETVTKRNLSTGIEDIKTEVFRGGNELSYGSHKVLLISLIRSQIKIMDNEK